MMTLAIDRRFECAPHASRSVAMALAISLNCAIVLIAMRPSTPYTLHPPLPRAIMATLLATPPPALPLPFVPTLHVTDHVATPTVKFTPAVIATTPVLTPVTPVSTSGPAPATEPVAHPVVADSSATVAYATATPPAYPLTALRAGVAGTVTLKVLVDASGVPLKVTVEHSSGSRALDNAARSHVLAAWRFHPAIHDGHAIEAWVLVPVRFALNNR